MSKEDGGERSFARSSSSQPEGRSNRTWLRRVREPEPITLRGDRVETTGASFSAAYPSLTGCCGPTPLAPNETTATSALLAVNRALAGHGK